MTSLALAGGTLYVGVQAKTAQVRTFDLNGRELEAHFSFRDADVGRSQAAGLAVDEDHLILVADTAAHRVRRFSLFGREVGGLGVPGHAANAGAVLPGLVTSPVDVETSGNSSEGSVAIACGGERRHAVQVFEPDLTFRASYPSFGEAGRSFRGVCRIAADGDRLYVAESAGRCVQVFRSGRFLHAFHLTERDGERFEPSALGPTGDGRLVLGCRAPRSALFLVDGSGRLLRQLAVEGEEEGAVADPRDVVVERGAEDRLTRLFVIDRDGLRVQVFTLEGRCLGTIPLDGVLAGRGTPPVDEEEREEKKGR